MRGRIWIFAALVAVALALHLALLSAKVAQSGEDNVRAHLALSTSALRAQLEMLDARLAPRAVSSAPELVEATRASDRGESPGRPDERALRAAASSLSPEPDLVAVVTGQGGLVSRRGKGPQGLDDAGRLPLARAALEGNPAPGFALFDGAVYRLGAARVPGNAAAAVVGTLIDDRFAAQLKSQVDADVTFLQGGKVLASSLPQGDARARLQRWAASPSPGYGVLPVPLPFVGDALSGKLPRGATRYAVRGALVSIDSGVQAALTVPAAPYLGWLGRYQAFYLLGFALFLLFSLLWGLLARAPRAARVPEPQPVPDDTVGPVMRKPRAASLADEGEAQPAVEPLEAALPESEAEPAAVVGEVDAPEPSAAAPEAEPGPPAPAEGAAEGEGAQESFPGDEPTRIEPVSAALLDKLREHDDLAARAATAEGPAGGGEKAAAAPGQSSNPPPEEAAAPPLPEGEAGSDPDEQHWRETYDQFCELKARLGESPDRISFDRFASKLRKNRADLQARHNCRSVRFSVYEKDGKAAIKASAIR